jgi:serine/threonine protein kinase
MRQVDDRIAGAGAGAPRTRVGTEVGGYTLVCPIGEAGEVVAYLAAHAVLSTLRVVKLLPPELTCDARALQRFVTEARAAVGAQHRNLIAVHDVGALADGAWFVVLDHPAGGTLGQWIARRGGPMPLDEIAHVVGEAAHGLEAARDRGLARRDLTPAGIGRVLRDGDPGRVVLLDVGVARLGDAAVRGRADLAPERRGGAALGPAADVFALGAIAYRMTTGGWFPPADLPADPRDRVPDLPAAWALALRAATATDPARRPASPRELARALFAAVPAGAAGAAGPAGAAGAAGPPVSGPAVPAPRSDRRGGDRGSRYQLGDRLGGGGMAEVFAATMHGAEGFARQVAIKRVLPELSRLPAFAAMFVAEARIAARLLHPNIVSVLDFARDADGRLALVMEYVDGKDLASVLAAGAVPPSVAIYVLIELLRGLGYAHELADPPPADGATAARGVVHRDVSPQNVLVSYEGAVKLSDFGLAKVRVAGGAARSEVVRGKPSYMAPEQASAGALDGRTDLYAAGVMLWEMLADRPLFTGTPREISAQVMFRDCPRPSQFRAGVPADLEAVAMTLLARERDARHASAEAAIDALLGCVDAPRDGRGELRRLMAVRFLGAPDPAAGAAPRASAGPITASEPSGIAGSR